MSCDIDFKGGLTPFWGNGTQRRWAWYRKLEEIGFAQRVPSVKSRKGKQLLFKNSGFVQVIILRTVPLSFLFQSALYGCVYQQCILRVQSSCSSSVYACLNYVSRSNATNTYLDLSSFDNFNLIASFKTSIIVIEYFFAFLIPFSKLCRMIIIL